MGNHQKVTFIQIAAAAAAVLLLAASVSEARSESGSLFDVSAACKDAADPSLCQSLPHVGSARELAAAAIAVATVKAKEALALTTKLIANRGTDEAMAQCLDQCRQMFDSTIDSLTSAGKILKGTETTGKNFMTELSATVTFVETCADAFKEQPQLVSPVAHIRDILAKFVLNTVRLGDQLKI